MDYNSIILELMSRIKDLENKMEHYEKILLNNEIITQNELFSSTNFEELSTDVNGLKKEKMITTTEIKEYILSLIEKAKIENQNSIILVARNIHNDLKLKSRYPMVCNAMRDCMKQGDIVLFSPESGYSSTLEIEYKIN